LTQANLRFRLRLRAASKTTAIRQPSIVNASPRRYGPPALHGQFFDAGGPADTNYIVRVAGGILQTLDAVTFKPIRTAGGWVEGFVYLRPNLHSAIMGIWPFTTETIEKEAPRCTQRRSARR
jgi:hypothetical protein